MAQRNKIPVSFSSISYNSANVDSRWFLEVGQGAGVVNVGNDIAKATIISDLFGSIGSAAVNTAPFGETTGTGVVQHGNVTVAVRIPQTKRILDVVLTHAAASDAGSLFSTDKMAYDIFISGRSDKKYSEIIDWVKVSDNTAQVHDLTTDPSNVFLPIDDGLTYVKNNGRRYHSRIFPFYCSWVKIVFKNITTQSGIPDLFLEDIELYDFEEDTTITEGEPTIEMVFPNSNSKWLPSQTAYFTARIYEPDTDSCHFKFDIFKETTGDTSLSGGDTLVATIASNALNLDGSTNENYTHDWSSLPLTAVSALNKVFLPGYPVDDPITPTNPFSVLVVPIESPSGVGTSVNIGNIIFYDNVGNTLKFDAAASGVTFTPITIPSIPGQANATGWVIDLGAETKFNRIDIVNASAGESPTKVQIYYNTISIVSTEATLVNGVWNNSNLPGNFRGPNWEAKIEYVWPDVGITGTYDPSTGARPLIGYKEGTTGIGGEIEVNPDLYNPDRNAVGITETNPGDWTKVPKFSGIMVGPSYSAANTGGTPSYTASIDFGDSPVPANVGTSGVSTVLGAGIKIDNLATPTIGTDVAHRVCYVRVALADPYEDGDRFYAKAYVWDGRTKVV